jgi:hypothetical protein
MNDKLPELQNGQQGPNAQDPSRRRLLRAAASAAPLIATLPSGAAAQAIASAAQVLVEEKDLNQGLNGADGGPAADGGEYRVPNGTTDRWIRYRAVRVLWVQLSDPPDPTKPNNIPTYRFSTDAANGPWYLEGGDEFRLSNPAEYKQASNTPVDVLALYRPILSAAGPMGVMASPKGVMDTTCRNANPLDTAVPKDVCVFPFGRLQRSSLDGNMAISQSALNSFA